MTSMEKISSIELPDNDTYKMTKIRANPAQPNWVQEGYTVVGGLATNPIIVGQRCRIVRSISKMIDTSPVTSIELTDDSSIILLHTESGSIYEIVNLDMVNAVKKV